MKGFRVIGSAIFFMLFNSFQVGVDDSLFLSVVEKAVMTYSRPANTTEVNIINNDELNYLYAIKDTVNKIEMRYLIYPLQELVKKYNTGQADTGMPLLDPNMIHTNLLLMYAYKIQGKEVNLSEMPEIIEIPHATVDLEYNADWGAKVTVQPCDEFAQKYKYCTIFEIHKDNIADAYILFLYNDKDKFEDAVKPDYHSLSFKK